MDNVLWLLLGLIIGWLARWVYITLRAPKLPSADQANANLKSRLTTAEEQVGRLSAQLEQARQSSPKVVIKEKDRLEKIRGIGPVFARRLNEAGVFTFTDLAALHPERVSDIISPEDWQAIDPTGWITEAAELVRKGTIQEEVTSST